MLSYAQNGEDVLLRRLFAEDHVGFYVDVGAHHPVHDSVTCYFHRRGWTGINIEPLPEAFAKLAQERPADVNLNVGVSDAAGELRFYECLDHPALSTFSAEVAAHHRREGSRFVEHAVPVVTLADVFARHVDREVDFLSVDVEGLEREVFESADFERWRPRVVLVEATHPNSPIVSHEAWEHLLTRAGYLLATFDGLNRFYVRQEDADLCERLRTPLNVFDNFVPYRYWLWQQEAKNLRAQLEDLSRRQQERSERRGLRDWLRFLRSR